MVKEFAEILTDWQIDKHLLIQASVVVLLHTANIFQLGEVTQGVASLEEDVEGLLVFDALNHTNYIVNLIAVEHSLEEAGEGLGALTDHVLDLGHQLFLAAALEHHDFDRVGFVDDVGIVVSVL